jgi:hypothetical protein
MGSEVVKAPGMRSAAEAGFYRVFILVDGLNSAGNTTQKKPDEKAEQDSGKD